MKKLLVFAFLSVLLTTSCQLFLAKADNKVEVVKEAGQFFLFVDGEKFIINGMNWDYIPRGTNTINAEFWKKSDDLIKAGLESEMSLLRDMHVNVIRLYIGIPPKWIEYIHKNYGIYTMLNHSFGRYGLLLNGEWNPTTDYSDPRTQEILLAEVKALAEEYKNTPGLLMYLLGNENNYGLFWAGSETEDFPDDEKEKEFIGEKRGRPMYALMNQASILMKSVDPTHPVAICNGDIQFIDIIAEECSDVDIYGSNTYRGSSFGDMFQIVREKLNMPIMFTEFGADAFDAIKMREDQRSQAFYLFENWKEIYENVGGIGGHGNSIGGCSFQFSDGWWKYGFDDRVNESVHDSTASWGNGGYREDFRLGENNMNEEWFGICAKGPTDPDGLYTLQPRAAYFILQQVHQFDPYTKMANIDALDKYFSSIKISDALKKAESN